MTRIKINARRIFSLLIPFFFFTSVHAEQTAAPAKPVTVEAKNETFAPQHPDQYLSWKATSEQSERVDALAEDPRLSSDSDVWIKLSNRKQPGVRGNKREETLSGKA